jgi:hypothetical protein
MKTNLHENDERVAFSNNSLLKGGFMRHEWFETLEESEQE